VFLAVVPAVFSQNVQTLSPPSFRYVSHFAGTSLAGTDSLGQPHLLPFQNDNSTISTDKINGYPAVKIDSAGGYFSFTTEKLLDRDNALFLIVFEPKDSDYLSEQALWSVQNGSRKQFLTSYNAGDDKMNVKYNYFPQAGASVTTNYVHFAKRNENDSVVISPIDTVFIGKCDTVSFRGKLAEFLIIDKPFTAVERQIWQSYLTLKYGVTMYKGNYLNAQGDTLWHYDQNLDYTAGVGGIGRDDSISLAQNFSTIYGDSIKIALHNYINDAVQATTTPFDNGEYIFWGHNGEPVEIGNLYFYIDNAFYNLYQRKWKVKPLVQNAYNLDVNLSKSPLEDLGGLKLFVSETESFDNLSTAIYTANIIDNQKVRFSNIAIPQTFDNDFYFTFGYSADDLGDFNNITVSNTSSSQELSAIEQVFTDAHYLPNPVVSDLHITYTLTRDATVWFSVHNNTGLPFCQTSPSTKPAGDGETIIPMSGLIQGTYTVYIHVDDMVMPHIVIKN
jgi:hypothetical protein